MINRKVINYLLDKEQKELADRKEKIEKAIAWFNKVQIPGDIIEGIGGIYLRYNDILCVFTELEISITITFTIRPISINENAGSGNGVEHKISF